MKVISAAVAMFYKARRQYPTSENCISYKPEVEQYAEPEVCP